MIGPVVEGFGMGHQTENPTAGITYPGDIMNRSVGVERKPQVCGSAVGHCIPEHHLVIINQTTDGGWVGIKFSFPMPYGKFQPVYSAGTTFNVTQSSLKFPQSLNVSATDLRV